MTTHTHTAQITVEVEIEYEYEPGEPMQRYDKNGTGYPGLPAGVAIEKVLLGNVDILNALDSKLIDSLEDECLEEHSEE
jgi:hypothetical protein